MRHTLARLRGQVGRLRAVVARRRQRWELVGKLPKRAVGAEVGTWKGDFASQLLRRTRPARLYLIDPWEYRDDPAYARAMFGDRSPGGQQRMDAIHDAVRERFRRQIDAGTVIVRRSRSVEAARDLEPLDWVYIDGDHTYDAVLADLAAYYQLVKPGGVVAGDDYGMVGWWEDGVRRAVDQFAAEHACELVIVGNQFRISKSS
jgi:hypothetical protein